MSDGAIGRLRATVVGAAITFAVLSPLVGLAFGLEMYGDGSIFAYSVAARDAWAFHWHNISGRIFSYLAFYVPADIVVAATGSAMAGIYAYGALLFSAPAISLLAVRALDPSPHRTVFAFACGSTAAILPFCFGFPTEMAMAHALFWPTLALALDARGGMPRSVGLYALFQSLVLTHEGGVALAACIALASLVARPRRGIGAYAAAMVVWAVVKLTLPPDAHIAGVLGAAAYKFVDPANLTDPAFLLAAAVLGAFAALYAVTGRTNLAALLAASGAAVYWLIFDRALLAEMRYSLRTILLLATPLFGAFAALFAADLPRIRTLPFGAHFIRLRDWLSRRDCVAFTAAFCLVMLVHSVEIAKFVAGWNSYKTAVRMLATGTFADSQLGDARFVSAARIDPATYRLAWNSTTPYLSVLLAPDFNPARLVVDPAAGYFWLSCETATRNARADNPLPPAARELVRALSCLAR
ncbi:MAG: hypothetical protein GC202_07110 [Alphaproteobacteria bacterium]|nr:hypothetical protein [Alphaproteobacteria bacterium]